MWIVHGAELAERALEQHAKSKQNEGQEDHGPKKGTEARQTAIDKQRELLEHFEFQNPHKLRETCKTEESDQCDVSQRQDITQERDDQVCHSQDHHEKVKNVPQHVAAAEVLGKSVDAHLHHDFKEKDERETQFAPVPSNVACIPVCADADDGGIAENHNADEGVHEPQASLHPRVWPALVGNVQVFTTRVGGHSNLPDGILSQQDVSHLGHGLNELSILPCLLKLVLGLVTRHKRAVGLKHHLLRWLLRPCCHAEILVELGDGLRKQGLLLGRHLIALALLVEIHLTDLARIDGYLVLGTEKVKCS
mmetsp:Transcript_97693/g.226550  ORF Transcript_97693/g.226550 Transcript_97693/m.226550 type:complete len:307 (+) Transcript_97693:1005-1925(+)